MGRSDLLYRGSREVAGWHSTPKPSPRIPFACGRKNRIEFGYVFARDLEFNDELTSVSLDVSLVFRLGTDY